MPVYSPSNAASEGDNVRFASNRNKTKHWSKTESCEVLLCKWISKKAHGKSPQGNIVDNAITAVVLSKKQGEVSQRNKTKGRLRSVVGGKSIIIAGDQSFYAQKVNKT